MGVLKDLYLGVFRVANSLILNQNGGIYMQIFGKVKNFPASKKILIFIKYFLSDVDNFENIDNYRNPISKPSDIDILKYRRKNFRYFFRY